MVSHTRVFSYAQDRPESWVDRFGVWLSQRQFRRYLTDLSDKKVADFGCGYHARLGRKLAENAQSLFLVDITLDPSLSQRKATTCLEGHLPTCLSQINSEQFDVIFLNSVLEHVSQDSVLVKEVYRLLVRGGMALINVPSWRGKAWLEWSGFDMGFSPKEEMDDHKRYYDVKDLWPMLVAAGFRPSRIKSFSHKFGLNTFAVCVKS